MPRARLVLDTNVWISGLLWTGSPHQILRLAEEGRVVVAVSAAIVQEVADALARTKFAARLAAVRTSVPELVGSLLTLAEVYPPPRIIPVVTIDPADDKILACARAAHARWLVSGDQHLLALRQYRGIRIVTPQAFLKEWGKLARSPK